MIKTLLLLPLFLLISCGEEGKSWPLEYYIHSDYPAEHHKEIFEAAEILNEAVGETVYEIVGLTTDEKSNEDGKCVIYMLDDIDPKPEVVGKAIQGNDSCDITIKSTVFGGCITYPDGGMICTSGYPFEVNRAIMMHEMIHCGGVWYHSENEADLMYKSLRTNVTMPTDWDIEQLKKALDLE